MKISRQPAASAIRAPIMGAVTGAMPWMAPTTAIRVASSLPACRSAAIERDITTAPEAPSPSRKRIAMKVSMSGAKTAPAVASEKTVRLAASGILRPRVSESGPIQSCPAASPHIVAERPNCTIEADAPKSAV